MMNENMTFFRFNILIYHVIGPKTLSAIQMEFNHIIFNACLIACSTVNAG